MFNLCLLCSLVSDIELNTWREIPYLHAGLYIRAGSRRSSPASLPGFAGYFYCFTSLNMSRRWTHNRLLFTKLRLLKNLKKTLYTQPCIILSVHIGVQWHEQGLDDFLFLFAANCEIERVIFGWLLLHVLLHMWWKLSTIYRARNCA